jgi:8-oxo-dGTP pyrophosphatase MutT (NUDIX family)
MQFDEGIKRIRFSLEKPLPGEEVQYLMAPVQRKTREEYLAANPVHRNSSILILLYPGPDGFLSTLLIKRPVNSGVHSGQIAFPGGKVEPGETRENAALREAHEEVGILPSQVELAGELTSMFIPASNFLVHSFIGITTQTPQFIPNPEEVALLLPTSLEDLLTMPVKEKVFNTSYGQLNAPYFDLNGHLIWGATAMIINEFREVAARNL